MSSNPARRLSAGLDLLKLAWHQIQTVLTADRPMGGSLKTELDEIGIKPSARAWSRERTQGPQMAITKCKSNGRARYKVEAWNAGEKVATRRFDTREEAEAWHEQVRRAYSTGTVARLRAFEMTFGEVIARYEQHPRGLQALRPSSQSTIESKLPYLKNAPIAWVRMASFTDATVDLWLDWILGEPTASSSKRKSFLFELRVMSIVLNFYRNYVNAGFIVQIVKRHKDRARYKPVKRRRSDWYMRPEHVRPWVDHLARHRFGDLVYSRLARFMVQTGTRIGEAAGLCWDQVDVDRGEVRICRTVYWPRRDSRGKGIIDDHVKTDASDRVLTLTDDLKAMLLEIRREGPGIGRTPVFLTRRGELVRYERVCRVFSRAFKALDLPFSATHICRHTNATIGLLANDGNISAVQAQLGQGDRGTTEGYAKAIACLDPATAQKTAAKMGF